MWGDDDVVARWLDADPLGGIEAPKPSPNQDADSTSPAAVLGEHAMRSRLANGTAETHPAGLLGTVTSFGHWWICDLDTGTWQRVNDARLAEQLDLLTEGYDDQDETTEAEDLSYVQNRGREPDPD
ncbi:hypothetical protein [Glycomyces tenuis]|uniref:hypothetical protein n=1 Tax=Glycomyces tenuis TaxID=58116 RepID=UPI0012DF4771|nr:hypothetical protein [Glycomyces tenuis]